MKANANDQDSEIQPHFELRFERSHSHSARGQCLVDVFLKNNGDIAASFPFFCLTDLGLNVSPAPGWDKQEITSVRKIQRVTSCEMNSSTLESNAAAHCCTIILSYKSSFGGCLEFEPRREYLLANFPNLNLMCVVGAGNYPSKRILLQVPATALRKIIVEAVDGVTHSAQKLYDIADSEFVPLEAT